MDLKFVIIVATVPTGLQTCAKVLQMHLSGSEGTPWMQPKSNLTFTIGYFDVFKFFVTDFRFKACHYGGHCAQRVANLCKSAVNAPSGSLGTPWLQPKSNVTF